MIRNVPNKYTRQMLMEALNVNFKKRYDFLYLPIDFQNKCNLGYAFVNMMAAGDVQRIFETMNGTDWGESRSHKICQIVWARVQGKSALLNHFRGMNYLANAPAEYVPISFFSDGERKGEVEEFSVK